MAKQHKPSASAMLEIGFAHYYLSQGYLESGMHGKAALHWNTCLQHLEAL
jgi:hypothetical protein